MAKTTKGSIPVPHSLATQHVKFSFRHLDTENPKYSLQKCCVEFFSRLVRALARYSSFTVEEFRIRDNKDGRHSHYFPHTSEPDGFTCLNDPEGLEMEEPWQIKLCPEIHEPPDGAWRVHGVLLADVFYIVWLDYEHVLYDNPKLSPGN